MKNLFNKYTPLAATLAIALFFAGCNVSGTHSGPDKAQRIAVKMRVQASSLPMTAAAKTSAPSILAIDHIKLLVDELELESALDRDSLDFEVNDLVVNLPLDGSEYVITSAVVPEGVYDEFGMEVDQPDGHSVNDPAFYNEKGEDYSIIVKGTYKGQPFTYRSHEEFELEMELEPPLKVTGNSAPSVAINVDPYSWFMDEAGNVLDPDDPANRAQIEQNIKQSFGAEKEEDDSDDDRDNENDNDDDSDND